MDGGFGEHVDRRARTAPAGRDGSGGTGGLAIGMHLIAATRTKRAGRPGYLHGTGPIDSDLAQDLAAAAVRNPGSTWCVTVTDEHGHAIGHGCATPAPATGRPGPRKRGRGSRGGHDPPRPPDPARPAFTVTPAGQTGPPGGYRTWRFSTGIPGQRDLIIEIGHDPGVMLRHLAQVRHATTTGSSKTPLDGRAAPRGTGPMDHALRTPGQHRTHPLPHLARPGREEPTTSTVAARRAPGCSDRLAKGRNVATFMATASPTLGGRAKP